MLRQCRIAMMGENVLGDPERRFFEDLRERVRAATAGKICHLL